jgi:hypothetical protein
MIVRNRRRDLLVLGSLSGALLLTLLTSSTAFGAGSGYGQGAPPSAAAGGFTRVITTKTIAKSGGTIRGSANGATAMVLVPAGSLPKGGQIVLTAGSRKSIDVGPRFALVADFSVVILNPRTGAKLAGPFHPPITITIHDLSIVPGDLIGVLIEPGHVTVVPDAQVTRGQAVIAFTHDPNYVVIHRH